MKTPSGPAASTKKYPIDSVIKGKVPCILCASPNILSMTGCRTAAIRSIRQARASIFFVLVFIRSKTNGLLVFQFWEIFGAIAPLITNKTIVESEASLAHI
ncbi:hypothetical protein D9M69_617730 [compost metagenome]